MQTVVRLFCLTTLTLMSGIVQAGELVVGQVTSLSGPNGSDLGRGLREGLSCAMQIANAHGGIHGQSIRLESVDDQYMPALTVDRTHELIASSHPVVLAGYRGTATSKALAESRLLEGAGIGLVGTLSGSTELQGVPGIFHTRTPYAREVASLVNHLLHINLTRIAVVYESGPFGDSGLQAVRSTLKAAGLAPAAAASYEKASDQFPASVDGAIAKITSEQPQAVVMIAVGEPLIRFVQGVRSKSPTIQLYGISVVDPGALVKALGPAAAGIGFSQVYPFPYSDSTRLSREYRNALKVCAPSAVPSYPSLEGYINGRVALEAMRRASTPITAKSVRAALEKMTEVDVGDMRFIFDPITHNGSSYVEVTIIDQDGILRR